MSHVVGARAILPCADRVSTVEASDIDLQRWGHRMKYGSRVDLMPCCCSSPEHDIG